MMICSPTKSGDFEHLHFYNIQYTNTKKPPRCAKSPDFEHKKPPAPLSVTVQRCAKSPDFEQKKTK